MSVESPLLTASHPLYKSTALKEDGSDDSSWQDETENYLKKIMSKCEKAAEEHEKAAYSMKSKNTRFAFPAMIIPMASAPIMGTFKEHEWVAYFGMGSMVVTAIFGGFSTFFRYGEKSQSHFNYAGRYADIVTDIEECLAKKVCKRASGSVVMRTMRMKYDNLNLTAPEC